MAVDTRDISKGDTVVYEFGFGFMEAKVIEVYDNLHVKVRHNDTFFLLKFMGYREVIPVDRIASIKKRGK